MRYGSVCSGIEAASCAWHPLGWSAAWLSEIERFPAKVLAHHYPDVPNLGDMRTISRRVLTGEVEAPDVLVGGTPCQAFSIAGLREGLADERGQLTISYVRLFDAIDYIRSRAGKRPAIACWENVPGVLSSKDNAFGCLLAGLAGEDVELVPPGKKWANAGCVYGPKRTVAWRVLDAQYFGVAQRRRRVFVVASARKDCDPAKILFEFDGVRRDSAPSREAGQETAGTLASRTGAGGCPGTDEACSGYLQAFGGGNTGGSIDVGTCLTTSGQRLDFDTETFAVQSVCVTGEITHTLKAEGFDASEDGTGRGQPIVTCDSLYNKGILNNEVLNARSKETNSGKALRILLQEIGEKAFTQWIFGILDSLQQAEVLRPALHGVGIRPTSFSRSWLVYCSLSCQEDRRGWLLLSLREAECEGCTSQGWQPSEQLADELGAYLSELSQSGAQAERLLRDLWCASQGVGILHQALSAFQEVGRSALDEGQSTQPIIQVRRLTPTECARLQAFPDDHLSQVRINGKPPTDGPMYRALGNSMCVNVMAFIGQRIQLANGRQLNQEAA